MNQNVELPSRAFETGRLNLESLHYPAENELSALLDQRVAENMIRKMSGRQNIKF